MENMQSEVKQPVPLQGESEEQPPAGGGEKLERRVFAIASAPILGFKMKLEREFPAPVKFLSLQAILRVREGQDATSNFDYAGFTSVVAMAGEKREGQLEHVAKVYTFHFPPILPHHVQIEILYILLTFVVLSFRRMGIVPHIHYVPFTDTLSLVVYDKEEGEDRQVVWEVILPFRELILEPTEEHTFITYRRGKIRLVIAKFWELPAFAHDD